MELEVTMFSEWHFCKWSCFHTLTLWNFPLQPEYKIADPICTYVFSILVVFTTIRILCDTGVIILEGKICAQSAVLYMENTSFLDIMIPISVWVVPGTCLSWCCFSLVALYGSSKFQQFLGVFVGRTAQVLCLHSLYHQEKWNVQNFLVCLQWLQLNQVNICPDSVLQSHFYYL